MVPRFLDLQTVVCKDAHGTFGCMEIGSWNQTCGGPHEVFAELLGVSHGVKNKNALSLKSRHKRTPS